MTSAKHSRPRREPAWKGSTERLHLAALAAALAPYEVWARVLDDHAPMLRVSNPESWYAIEDITCVGQQHSYVFCTSFGVHIGNTGDLAGSARRIAWLVGMADPHPDQTKQP